MDKVTAFTPTTYIYSKRELPTQVDCDLLKIPNLRTKKIIKLKKELFKRKPKIVVLAKDLHFNDDEEASLSNLTAWFKKYVDESYKLINTLNFSHEINGGKETFFIYQRL